MSDSLFLEILYEVDWTEPWLLCLLAFHLLTTITILLLHNHHYIQAAILASLCLLCYFSEWINEYAAMNYSVFSKEQYFDPHGFFIFIVLSGPVILNCFIVVLSWLWNVWHMMVKVGRLKRHKKTRPTEPHPTAPHPRPGATHPTAPRPVGSPAQTKKEQ